METEGARHDPKPVSGLDDGDQGDHDAGLAGASSDVVWLKLFSRLIPGSNISRLSVSARLSSPESALQRADRPLERIAILAGARELPTGCERMAAVLRFALSSCVTPEPTPGFENKKAHAPILGEVHASKLVSQSAGTAVQVVEHVSYEPRPGLTAAHVEALDMGVTMESISSPTLTWHGNYISIDMSRGTAAIAIGEESYEIQSGPRINIRNLLLGKLFTEYCGTLRIVCHATGLEGTIHYKPSGLLGMLGGRNRVSGEVREVASGRRRLAFKGVWSGVVASLDSATGKPNGEIFYDDLEARRLFSMTRVELEGLGDNDSRELWKDVNEALHRGDFVGANLAKKRLTRAQRDRAAHLTSSGVQHEPQFFYRAPAVGRAGSEWRVRPGVAAQLRAHRHISR